MKEILLTSLRDKHTSREQFRHTSHHLARILAYETSLLLAHQSIMVHTPLGVAIEGLACAQESILVPILRSGLSLLPAFLEYFPTSSVGFIGLQRTLENHERYYYKVPTIKNDSYIIILDPMIATGKTASAAINLLKTHGVREDRIIMVAFIGSKKGLSFLHNSFPHVRHITAAIDPHITEDNYIVPGLGDFGDRYFGT